MSDVIDTPKLELGAPIPFEPPRRRWPRRSRGRRPPKPKLRKLRLLAVLIGLAVLAFISTVFGMMMAVASDLPQLENKQQYKREANTFLYDDTGKPIGIFAPPNHVVIDTTTEISPYMQDAIIAVEDKTFRTNPGVDIRGIARAFIADITGGATQGASTITEQFVKNALAQQGNRTVFEKLREAALAYHLTRKWTKDKILTEYLNSIYFGNGAYGVESAARVYFGKQHGYDQAAGTNQSNGVCGDTTDPKQPRPKCASVLAPEEAALLAGMVASPTALDPLVHPKAAFDRRNLVLKDMLHQNMITRDQYGVAINKALPTAIDIQQPSEPSQAPYFTSWLRPQIIAALSHGVPQSIAEYRAFYGGLKIKTTLDLNMQHAAEQSITANLPSGPTASLVAIDNKTGEVRAMIGGQDYNATPFNLATEGHRQPGSAFKPFTLAEALRTGEYSPYSVIDSAPQDFIVPNSAGKEHFIVHNFGNTYSGPISLTTATAISDNTVFSQVGIHVGTARIARLATQMGIRSPVSNNYAMILGGLRIGVTPLDMAHAYETLAMNGQRVYNPVLGAPSEGPTGIASITCPPKTCKSVVDHPTYQQVLPPAVAKTVHDMLTGVVTSGTGTKAAISGVSVAGKTGTTSNYGDAWFVGWTPQMTCAVWVGYPNKLVSMSTLYNGQPVEGGTYPAIIWHDFMVQALQIIAQEQAAAQNGKTATTTGTTTSSTPSLSSTGSGAGAATATSPTTPTAGAAPATGATGAGGGAGVGAGAAAPAPTAAGNGAGTGAATGGSTPAGGGTQTPGGTAAPTGSGTASGTGSGGAGLGASGSGH